MNNVGRYINTDNNILQYCTGYDDICCTELYRFASVV